MPSYKLYLRLFRRLLANPRYFYYTLRRDAQWVIAGRLAKGDIPANGTFYPVKLDLRLLYRCNLRCRMCAQWGDTGTYFDFATSKQCMKLAFDVIESVIRELVPKGLWYVDMEGGETFLYPDIIRLFRMLKSYKLLAKPVTNGTLLKRYAREIVELHVDSVNISVDGDRETHNYVRQADWAYDRTMEGIEALAKERARARGQQPLIKVSFTMSRHNRAASLLKLVEDLSDRGLIDVLTIKSSPIWVPAEKGQEYIALVKKYFGVDDVRSWKGFLEDYSDFGEEAKKIAAAVRDVKARNLNFFVDRLPTIPCEDIPKLYTDYNWNLGRTHCAIPYVEPTIDSDGNVYPCNVFTDEQLSMGNVYETPFLDIWFGKRYQEFRRMLAEQEGLLPICNRCCQLVED